MSKFNERLKKLREESGITQNALAEKLGITPQSLSYYFNGREPNYDLLIKIADYFHVSVDYLLGRPEPEVKNTDYPQKLWKEFKDTGFLWWINMILHTFGWAIVVKYENREIVSVFPERVKFRGFPEKDNTAGYQKVTEFMNNNSSELLKETKL